MLNYESQNTDVIAVDFGFTEEEMDSFSEGMMQFFSDFSNVIREDFENDVDAADTARKFFAQAVATFDTQEKQDMLLIQLLANGYDDAQQNLRHIEFLKQLRADLENEE